MKEDTINKVLLKIKSGRLYNGHSLFLIGETYKSNIKSVDYIIQTFKEKAEMFIKDKGAINMMTLKERYIEEGIEEGIEKGSDEPFNERN